MTNADIIKGGHLMIFMNGAPLAFATSHTLSKTLNTNEISTKDHGDFAAIVPQNISWEATTENLYSLVGYQALNNAFNTMQPVTIYFGETSYDNTAVENGIVGTAETWTTAGFGETGDAYISSLQVTAGAGDNATFTATFTGTGKLVAAGATGAASPTGIQGN